MTSRPPNHERASFSLAVPGPLGGGRVFLFPYPVSTYDDFRARKEGAGHLVLPPIASTNYQAIFQISPSSLNKTRDQHAKSPVVLRSWAPTRSARRGVRVRRPTRPAGHGLHSSEQPMSPGTGRRPGLGCTLRERKMLSNSGGPGDILAPSTGGTEAVVRVTVRRGVPVTVRRADVRRLIVERPAPKQTRVWPPSAGSAFYRIDRSGGDTYWHGARDRSSS